MSSTPALPTSTLTVFLFTDLVDSTGWKKLGDYDYLTDIRLPHDRLFRELLAHYPGAREQDNAGDGFLAIFATPGEAVSFALRFHNALAKYPWDDAVTRTGRRPATRIGIHLGEVMEFEDRNARKVAGQAVDLAARVMSLGRGGQTLLTRHAFDSARQHLHNDPASGGPLAWVAHGRYRFKGNDDDPLEVFGVAAEGSPALAPPADSEKAKRVEVNADDDTGAWRPAVGLVIPRRDGWVLEKRLGEGGFGEVWLAKHARTKGHRVFKFCFDADRLQSFKRELTLFRLLQSEFGDRNDFARLYDVQVERPPYFLESEYVAEGNLLEWVERHGFANWPVDDRVRFVAEAARTVAAAHSLGIIHKDLKPSNILIRVEGGRPHPLISDFGIGVLTDRSILGRWNITSTENTPSLLQNESSRTGTRLYSPPEALLGKPATTAHDVYALGVLLHQLLVGDLEQPLTTGWEDALADIPHGELLREDIRAATLPVEKRLATATLLAERLEQLLSREAENDLKRRADAQVKRLRVLKQALAVSTAVGISVAAATVYAFAQREHARENERQALEEKRRADEQTEKAAAEAKSTADALSRLDEQFRERKRLLDLSRLRTAQIELSEGSSRVAGVALQSVDSANRCLGWNYLNRRLAGTPVRFRGHTAAVTAVAFSHFGDLMASASADRSVRLWSVRTGTCIREMSGLQSVGHIAFLPDDRLVVATQDGAIFVSDIRGGLAGSSFRAKGQVMCLSVAADGLSAAVGLADGSAQVFDTASGRLLVTAGPADPRSQLGVKCVSLSADGSLLATGSADKSVEMWSVRTGNRLARFEGNRSEMKAVCLAPNGVLLVTASADSTITAWDLLNRKKVAEFCANGPLQAFNITADATRSASVLSNNIIQVRDANNNPSVVNFNADPHPAGCVAISPDGTKVAAGSDDGVIHLWDAVHGDASYVFAGANLGRPAVAVSSDGRLLATAGEGAAGDHAIQLWSTRDGTLLRTIPLQDRADSVAMCPEGSFVVTASAHGAARLWDIRSGVLAGEVLDPHGTGTADVSSGGTWLVTGSAAVNPGEVVRWHVPSGRKQVFTGPPATVVGVRISVDGRKIAAGFADGSARVWDAETGSAVRIPAAGQATRGIALSPDFRYLATASEDGTARLWDAEKGTQLSLFEGHTAAVTCVAISKDGTRVVTGAEDHTLRLWDAETKLCLLKLRGHRHFITGVGIDARSDMVVSGSWDGTVRLWDCRPSSDSADRGAALSARLWITRSDPAWHALQEERFKAEGDQYAAALHRSFEQHARGVAALDYNRWDEAYWRFVAAALLKPPVPKAVPIEKHK